MADQRRRGRGRSGRGGRIPRKGDAQGGSALHDETFVTFPRDVTSSIQVPSTVDPEAVTRALRQTLGRERRQSAQLQALAERLGDSVLSDLRTQVDQHRQALEQLARELGADLNGDRDAENGDGGADLFALVTEQQLSRLGWIGLQQLAYASGDRRIDRAVKRVLPDKQRHAEVLECYAARESSRVLFRDPEE